MNGIIHGCTHPSDMDLTATSLSVRDMCMGIMQYLDRIITQIVKPRVSVYMAIDGVAPRAKLNQQRSRRFRSAKDMAEAHAHAAASDGSSNNDSDDENNNSNNNAQSNKKKKDSFDSNCITPGTEFLAMVSETISYFIRQKLKEDAAWHGLTVIFSGHDIPGEGEHKIMQHIRQMRASPNYAPNTRHCIYGQDADLIMLGLVTHEPHFTILREVIDFNSFQNNNNRNALKEVKKFTKESDFQLLHLSVLREYLQIEFCS
jgi:5'-3' exoribonuclease 1